MRPALLVTCEHASNAVPSALGPLFIHDRSVLGTHRAWDIGAADMARRIASEFDAPIFAGTFSRLVVDLNRSETNRVLFSAFTRGMSHDDRESVLRDYYRPYRHDVSRQVRLMSGREIVFHVAVHSFTPVLNNVKRECDIGLLYDPSRSSERQLAARWKILLEERGYRVRRNYPYRGISDGLTGWLRREYAGGIYAGIELELNQTILENNERKRIAAADLVATIRKILDEFIPDL